MQLTPAMREIEEPVRMLELVEHEQNDWEYARRQGPEVLPALWPSTTAL